MARMMVVGILGSSMGRRNDLLNKAWELVRAEIGAPIHGAVAEPSPMVSQRPSIDIDIRSRVLMWQERGLASEGAEFLMSEGLEYGILFCPYTAYAFLVESIMFNHDISQQLRDSKSILLDAQGNPQFTSPEMLAKANENNLVAHNIARLQSLANDYYEGFFDYIFMLGSDEEPASLLYSFGEKNPPVPVGTREQIRHYHFTKVDEAFGFGATPLSSDLDQAAKELASVILSDFKGEEAGDDKEVGEEAVGE